jgi:hypothetical protein
LRAEAVIIVGNPLAAAVGMHLVQGREIRKSIQNGTLQIRVGYVQGKGKAMGEQERFPIAVFIAEIKKRRLGTYRVYTVAVRQPERTPVPIVYLAGFRERGNPRAA